jgi:hypothetical protein
MESKLNLSSETDVHCLAFYCDVHMVLINQPQREESEDWMRQSSTRLQLY